MFFNGDYFDIILFCVMAALLIIPAITHRASVKKAFIKAACYCKKYIKLLFSNIRSRKPAGILLNLSIQVFIAVFLSRDSFPGRDIPDILGVFFLSLLKVFGLYLLLLFVTHIYFTFIRAYFQISSLAKRILTLTTLIIIIIMEKHTANSVFTIAVFVLIIICYYCINMLALIRTVRIAKQKAMEVKAIWQNVIGIIGMFIVLFSVLYYEIGVTFPDAFNKSISLLDSVYFTLVTFATIGFGDIAATSDFTKLVTILNALTSIACLVFLVNAIMGFTSGGDNINGKEPL